MQFNTYAFILIFLPVVVSGYYIFNKKSIFWGKIFLIIMSIIFYCFAGIECILLICISILMNYGISYFMRWVEKSKRPLLIAGIVLNIAVLLYCKYCNFFISTIDHIINLDIAAKEILLPLGISFYTFQQIMFLVDVSIYKKYYSFWDYTLYILFFPKIMMGPLIEPTDFISQVNKPAQKELYYEKIAAGVQLFVFGLLKKVIIADTLAKAVDWGGTNITECTSLDLMVVILSYTLYIYFDFSGYSDMAIGISEMLNIDLPMNFDSPYKAVSIRDFWKRWHISLTAFLTKYIYIPLGGSRRSRSRTYLNTMIVFLISGLWHGANWTFVVWGGLHGFLMVIDRMNQKWWDKLPKFLRWMVTFTLVNLLWSLFWLDSMSDVLYLFQRIIALNDLGFSAGLEECFCLKEFSFLGNELGIAFIQNHLWSLSALGMLSIPLGICVFAENNNRCKKISVGSLILVILTSTWCMINLGVETTKFIYSGF